MQQETKLRITSWNVLNQGYENPAYYTEDTYPFLHWNQGRNTRAADYLRKHDSDVYCLQEVSSVMANELLAALGERYKMHWAPRTETDAKAQDGLAVIYRGALLQLKDQFVWRYASGKHIFLACLFASATNNKKRFWCVNTHVNFETREADLLALQKQVNDHAGFLSTQLVPKLIMGDFNAERSEEWYKALDRNGLLDAFGGVALGLRQQLTEGNDEHGWPYSYNSGKKAKWIDFILVHRLTTQYSVDGLVVNGSDVSSEFPRDQSMPNEKVPSDHLSIGVIMSGLV